MKKFRIILLLLVASFLAYLVWSYFAFTASDTTAKKAITNSGKNIKSIQEKFLSSGKEQIEAVKSFVAQIPEDANNAFNDVIDQTKNTIREKLNPFLETTSSLATLPISPHVSQNAVINGGVSQNSSKEPSVCFVVSKGEAVDYGIDQPFPGMEETSYKITWGDGKIINGLFHNGDKNVVVSHLYVQPGTYSIVFQLANSSTTLTASRSVCVK